MSLQPGLIYVGAFDLRTPDKIYEGFRDGDIRVEELA